MLRIFACLLVTFSAIFLSFCEDPLLIQNQRQTNSPSESGDDNSIEDPEAVVPSSSTGTTLLASCRVLDPIAEGSVPYYLGCSIFNGEEKYQPGAENWRVRYTLHNGAKTGWALPTGQEPNLQGEQVAFAIPLQLSIKPSVPFDALVEAVLSGGEKIYQQGSYKIEKTSNPSGR